MALLRNFWRVCFPVSSIQCPVVSSYSLSLSFWLILSNNFGAEPGERVEVDEAIAQIETDKVFV